MTAWSDGAFAWMALGMVVAVILGLTCLILFGPDVDDDWGDDEQDAATIQWLEDALKRDAFVDGDQLAFNREFDEITRAADWWGKR